MGIQGGQHVAICGPTGPTSFSIGASSTMYIASHGEALVLEGHRDAEEARVVVGDHQAAVPTPATKSACISPEASFTPLALKRHGGRDAETAVQTALEYCQREIHVPGCRGLGNGAAAEDGSNMVQEERGYFRREGGGRGGGVGVDGHLQTRYTTW